MLKALASLTAVWLRMYRLPVPTVSATFKYGLSIAAVSDILSFRFIRFDRLVVSVDGVIGQLLILTNPPVLLNAAGLYALVSIAEGVGVNFRLSLESVMPLPPF